MLSSTITNTSPYAVKAQIDLSTGSTGLHCSSDDILQQFTIERTCDATKFFGYGYCQKLNFKIFNTLNGFTINTSTIVDIHIGDGTEWESPFPKFYVTEVHKDEANDILSVTCYDDLYRLSDKTFGDLGLTPPYTVKDIANACSRLLYLKQDSVRLFLLDYDAFETEYPNGANFADDTPLREVLDDIAEATQTIYFMNYADRLEFKGLRYHDDPDRYNLLITKNDYYELKTKTNRRLAAICSATALGDNVEAKLEIAGTTQYIRDNGLWTLRDDIGSLVDNSLAAIGGLTLNQFDLDWDGNHLLELGDKIRIETDDGNFVDSYYLDDILTYDGAVGARTSWEYQGSDSETESNPTSLRDALNKTYARVDKAKQEITLQIENSLTKVEGDMSELEEDIMSKLEEDMSNVDTQITQLKLTTNGITATVATQEEKISTITDNITNLQSENKQLTEQIGLLSVKDDEILAEVSSLEKSTTDSVNNLDSKIDAEVNELDSRIDSVATETAALKLTSDSIQASVTKLDESMYSVMEQVNTKVTQNDVTISIEKALEQGIESVTTKTGFTFNEEGLHVSKSGSEMTTTVTEDGVRVLRNNSEVLTANNQGVKAEDLHATTFLIIGDNSRFEDYDSRTGCFWIGGN